MRPTPFDNGLGFGEPELDANSALTELDKGLRSSKLGEQVEAIVRFPALFERYPFPILINSAFLKLADVFRTGTNFLRLWVLRVCQQTERHLDKILNVDEFIRRIYSVIYANDPIARALSLRTLGSLSGLIAERKKVHHSIRVALDSNDRVEVSAAICAASAFAKRSETFGTTMCTKIASMVQRLSTPIDLKLRLIPIFKHMHHDVHTASMVRKLCLDLLVNYPAEQFVIIILHTLTELAAATITDLAAQVSLLLSHMEDVRTSVKLSILKDLKFLGSRGGHLWEPVHISILMEGSTSPDAMDIDDYVEMNNSVEVKRATLDVIYSLTSSSAILPFVHEYNSSLRRLLEATVQSSDMLSALKAIRIATRLAINWRDLRVSGGNLMDTAADGIESLLLSLCATRTPEDKETRVKLEQDLEHCLNCGVLLAKTDNAKCDWLMGVLVGVLQRDVIECARRNLIVQSIGSIGSIRFDAVINYLPDIYDILRNMNRESIREEGSTVATLVAVIFQVHQGHTLSSPYAALVEEIMNKGDMWLAYRIARNSLRFSQPEFAMISLGRMKTLTASENFHYWLTSLHSVASAEQLLSDVHANPRLISRITKANTLYLQGVSTMKAAISPLSQLQFPSEYLKVRSEMLTAFSNLLVSCNTLQLSPPADIAGTMATALRDDLLKCGRVVTQLRKSVREFQGISEMFGRLYQTAFDADSDSLQNIQILQRVCNLVARCIEKLVLPKDSSSSDDEQSLAFFRDMRYSDSGNMWTTVLACKQTTEVIRKLNALPTNNVTGKHVECLREIVKLLVESPMPYPRFFFQTLQMTRVKIAVSPQPRNPGEAVTVIHGNSLALKVEGVVEQSVSTKSDDSGENGIFRKPKAIRLTVVSTPIPNPRAHLTDPLKLNLEPITLTKDVVPHKDFFQAQFLLQVSSGGMTTVTVDTSLLDFEGRVWVTGPRATISVRVLDDPGIGKQSSSSSAATISIAGPSSSVPSSSSSTPASRIVNPVATAVAVSTIQARY